MPDNHDEAWRYTPVEAIVAALESAAPAPSTKPAIDRALVDELAGDHGGPRLVLVDGVLVPELSDGLDAIEVTWERSFAAGAGPAHEPEIGRAHVCTSVTNAQLVCLLLLAKLTQ